MLARTLLCACAATASALARPGLFAMRGRHAPRMVLDLAKTAQPDDSGEDVCVLDECVGDRSEAGTSYSAQYEDLFSAAAELQWKTSKPVPKPSNAAQAQVKGSVRVPFSNVYGTLMRGARSRAWTETDIGRTIWFTIAHTLGCLAFLPRFFSWRMLAIQFLVYCASGMGITYSYHRQLAHKSFKSPKWLEYLASVCGMMAFQGSPYEWVSDHRYHHLHTETPLDPHSSYEGFYWSHLGWMLDSHVYKQRCGDQSNAADLYAQPWYRWTHKNYMTIMAFHWTAVYALGGVAGLVWRAFFTALLYHVTWFVNSASHLWGRQEYKTGDQSRTRYPLALRLPRLLARTCSPPAPALTRVRALTPQVTTGGWAGSPLVKAGTTTTTPSSTARAMGCARASSTSPTRSSTCFAASASCTVSSFRRPRRSAASPSTPTPSSLSRRLRGEPRREGVTALERAPFRHMWTPEGRHLCEWRVRGRWRALMGQPGFPSRAASREQARPPRDARVGSRRARPRRAPRHTVRRMPYT